jgi:hypothetical protein
MLAKFVLAAQGARATRNHNHYLRPLIQNKLLTSMLVFRRGGGGGGVQKSYKMGKYFFYIWPESPAVNIPCDPIRCHEY